MPVVKLSAPKMPVAKLSRPLRTRVIVAPQINERARKWLEDGAPLPDLTETEEQCIRDIRAILASEQRADLAA